MWKEQTTVAREMVTIDGNQAAAYVAYKTNEVIAIYPITPSSPMGEHADEWSAWGERNIWGTVPLVAEMQSEAGAAGAAHGALQAGSLTTTFTSSQGLLLMIPNMYKIAGELTSTVFHIAARALATHALSIFCDHSDVMATRGTGWGMLFSNTPQEAMDMALIAQASTLEARVPFMHIFDGFRTSHEVRKLEQLREDDIRQMIDDELVRAHKARAMTPDRPILRGTAQNPDIFFQSRETVNPFYQATPGIVRKAMDRFAELVGRRYHLYEYVGAPDAERVIVLMGSACETAQETVEYLANRGEKVGVVKVRLYRPFAVDDFVQTLPPTTKSIAVLDRTKEAGATGEPLYQDVVTALNEGLASGTLPCQAPVRVIGGRYGLGSKEFIPGMVKAGLDELNKDKPLNHFTVGIEDDVSHTSLPYDVDFQVEPDDVFRAIFWGLGSDGTVSANKNSIKIIGQQTDNHAQGYFVYDSKKSGAHTISHLRFGPRPIHSEYLIYRANFIGVHQFGFLERFDIMGAAVEGATLLLNSPYAPEDTWDHIPRPVQQEIIDRKLKVYGINAYDIAEQTGMGVRINTIMQTAFFAISGILPKEQAIAQIKQAIQDTYGKRGESVVKKNFAAVDGALANLYPIEVPQQATSEFTIPPTVSEAAPEFVQKVTAPIMAGDGDQLPVSAMPKDGTFPIGTNQWEKRNIALEVPVWLPHVCIQCGRCSMYCPHAVIRAKVVDESLLANAPEGFKSIDARWREPGMQGKKFTIQVAVEDCTGCGVCVAVCPAKDKTAVNRKAINMEPQLPIRDQGRKHWAFFLDLPQYPAEATLRFDSTKNVQLLRPMFEFPSACAGCGETPYIRLLSQLFGDRMYVANATGCTSIYGANTPGTPWTYGDHGRGPTWNNSLFEDNAEFGYGMRLTVDKQTEYARELVSHLRDSIGADLADDLLSADQSTDEGIEAQRARVAELRKRLEKLRDPAAQNLLSVADMLVRKSVWCIGGDGWAYDIGYGGLDHVLAMGRNIKVLVVDSEVYSNTGGQASKSTGLAAVAKFAASGKPTPKKDLGMMAMTYGYIYVAQVAMGANDRQTLRAFREAESYNGPSLIIAYSTCIAHGINMGLGMDQEKRAVDSGHWILYRYDPRRREQGENPLQLDSGEPTLALRDYFYQENRYRMLTQSDPEQAERLLTEAQKVVLERWRKYSHLASMEIDLGADVETAVKGD
ncbi:MAG: pyruvate:ferredoxin (flavodoxin) oxidoreductase [Chloroflexi bacterium]|nr:pyruvate:ferredoxin (flavodoxin) oxidoreductase [Chloroflexota bacterium]